MNRQVSRFCRIVPILFFSVLAALTFASCADMFQPKIPKPDADERGSADTLFKQEEEITQLAAPSQLYVAPFYSRSEIRLSWEGVQNAAYYMIERAEVIPVQTNFGLEWETPDDGDYETLERFVYGNLYTDVILKNPSLDSPEYQYRYHYRVSAFNPAKNLDESEPCEPQYAMLFRAPSSIRASGGTAEEYIEVRWERTEDAVSYEVSKSATERGIPAYLGSVPSNQNYFVNYVDKEDQGKNFYYVVTAKNSFGNSSLQTKSAMGFAKMEGAPDAPVIRRSDGYGRGNSNRETRIEWDEVDDAEYYTVYRFSSTDSSLTRLVAGIEETFLIDSFGLKPGAYYYYRVQAIGIDRSSGNEIELKSPFSGPDLGDKKINELSFQERNELAESFIISPPDTVAAEREAGGSLTIKWLPSIGTDEERRQYTYTVFTHNSIEGDFTTVFSSGVAGSAIGSDGYIRTTGISTGQTLFFKVVAFNGAAESLPSIVVAPSPVAAVILGATQYAYIPDAAPNPNGVYPVRITWTKPANEDPAFYRVERSTRPDGSFAKINDVSLRADGIGGGAGYSFDGGTGVYSFIDRNDTARVGRKYYYRVLSLNQLEGGSFYSEVKTGWGALTHRLYALEYNKTMKSALKKLTYMHKPGSTEKLGTETKYGAISGQIYYNGQIAGLGARILIQLTDYAEFYIENEPANGVYFILNGNSNTTANMSSNGTMDGTVNCTGMYPGWLKYDGIEIKGGNAGGGTYEVQPAGFPAEKLSYTVLN
jgi:hypothetical protein